MVDDLTPRVCLHLLGTAAGPPPQVGRSGIATALSVDGRTYLVDAGRGAITQYTTAGLRLSDLEGIFVTHLHADHVCDLFDFFLLGGMRSSESGDSLSGSVGIYGPGPAGGLPDSVHPGRVSDLCPDRPTPGLRDLTELSAAAHAYSLNLFMRSTGLADVREQMDVHELQIPGDVHADADHRSPDMEPFVVMQDERVTVSATLVPHGPVFPSYAYRFDVRDGPSICFSGDTAASDNLVRMAKGADWLIHEAINDRWLAGKDGGAGMLTHLRESHTTATDAGEIAQRAGVGHLVLSHLVPADPSLTSSAAWRDMASKTFHGDVVVGEDLMVIEC